MKIKRQYDMEIFFIRTIVKVGYIEGSFFNTACLLEQFC